MDEEPPPAKRQRTSDTQTNRTGGAHDGGQQFEIKMAAVIGLRGMERGDDFELATNVKDAGNFDDLVYTANGRRYYLQLKHTENPDTTWLQPKDTVELLHKCFESYYKMEDKDKAEFIIYTNKRLGPKLSPHARNKTACNTVEGVFKTSEKGEIFNFTRDRNKKIDVYSAVENCVKKSKEFGDLSVPKQNDKVSMINEFFEKLIMVTGQKGQLKLDKVIYKEIKQRNKIKVGRELDQQVIRYFKTWIERWWRNKKEKMTPETLRNWLQEAKTKACAPVVRSLFKNCTKKLVGTGIKFSDSEISRLQPELSDNRAVHLRSDTLTLCSILLLDCLDTSKCIFVTLESLQSNKNMLLHALLGGHWEWLIVFCDSALQETVISSTFREIYEIINRDPSCKRVIILTECSVRQMSGFVPIEHEFRFEQLSNNSQEIVLDKKVDFQGCEVTMRSVLQRHCNVEHVLGPELVTDLITEGTIVNIGGKLQKNEGYYAPRVLERNIYLRLDILKDVHLLGHLFVVSGMRDNDLSEFVPSGQAVQTLSYSLKNGAFYRTSDETGSLEEVGFTRIEGNDLETCYAILCQNQSENTVHWVEFKERNFLWIRSSGATDSLLNYVDYGRTRLDTQVVAAYMKNPEGGINEEVIWNLGERTVLVVDVPGMGKSSTTTQVAWHTKERDPTSWVVRINWNDHTKKLQGIDAAKFNFDSLVEFLRSAAFPESKYTEINRSLLKHALQNGGNVTVLMDGYDEISPTHADKADVILSELMKTKVKRVWVTSRPVQKDRLEKELSVTAYGMRRLSFVSQEDMLIILWKSKADGGELRVDWLLAFIYDLLKNLNVLFYEPNFTGCPLYVTMIATVYEQDVDMCLNAEEWIPPRIDLVKMYEKFVERKLHIYLTEKQRADTTNSSVQDDHEFLKQIYLNNYEKCALVAILPPSLHNKKIEEEIQPFLSKVQDGKDKIGIVMNVVEGKPQFVHRTFAEYLTARWLSRNYFESKRSVLECILFEPEFGFVRSMFDRMLAEESALLRAVLEDDMLGCKELIEKGRDVKVVDKGGRTVVHLLAARSRRDGHYDRRITDFLDSISLCETSFDNRDCVLQWTPLQYAIKSENWFIVERLLQNNVERSGLDMIRQRAQDAPYTGRIIMHAAGYGHLLLLEFLCSIGVNINQASSRRYPSPLHAAIQREELPVIRMLIQHGANCNTPYSDGQTPLFYAVTNSSLDVVRALVEEGGASLDVRDDDGRSVFINRIYDFIWNFTVSNIPIEKYITERLNEIVNYLQERGCT